VFGYHVTEEVLQSAFSPMGKIVNISMEIEKVKSFRKAQKSREVSDFSFNHRQLRIDRLLIGTVCQHRFGRVVMLPATT
jgi:hypothetical protein